MPNTPRLARMQSRAGRPKEPPRWEWRDLTAAELEALEHALAQATGQTVADMRGEIVEVLAAQ
jgi:hypothetical protein